MKNLKLLTGFLHDKAQIALIIRVITNGQGFIKKIKINSQWTHSQSREVKPCGESKKVKTEKS